MPPAFSWFLAVRYLVTRWVSLIGMLGIAISVWAMIVVVAVFSGFIGDTRTGIREASPDLLVTELAADADFATLKDVLDADPDVAALSPRLSHDAILFPIGGWQLAKHTDAIASGAASAGNNYVLLLGVDPEAEARTTNFRSWLKAVDQKLSRPSGAIHSGSYAVEDLDHPFRVSPKRIRNAAGRLPGAAGTEPLLGPERGFVLGMQRLRSGDGIIPGQRVDILTARFVKTVIQEGPRKGQADYELKKSKSNLYLSGGYETDHRFFDLGTCFMHIEDLRDLRAEDPLSDAESVSEIAVKLKDGADPEAVRARIDARLKDFGGSKTLTWEQQNATYLGAVDRERTLMKIVLFAVLVVAGFLIFATLHMMVVQKTKDIGILTSMGATSGSIAAIFVLSSLAVGVVGCAIGMTTGFFSAFFLNDICAIFHIQLFPPHLYAIDEVPINLEPSWMLQVVAGAIFVSLIVAWLPARRAARLDPVKALMHE